LVLVMFLHHKVLKTGLDLTDGQVPNFVLFIPILHKSASYIEMAFVTYTL